jgi:hypothetical protein
MYFDSAVCGVCFVSGYLMMMSVSDFATSLVGQVVRKGFGRKWSWSKQDSILAFAWKD